MVPYVPALLVHGLTRPDPDSMTLLLALGTSTKLLHHSDVSSTPRGVIISCCCSLSSSSWNGFCSAYATNHGGAWYGLLSVFSCKENVPSKHPMPLKHIIKVFVYLLCGFSTLLFVAITAGTCKKVVCWFTRVSYLVLTIDFVLLLADFEMLSVFAQHLMTLSACCSVSDPWTVSCLHTAPYFSHHQHL